MTTATVPTATHTLNVRPDTLNAIAHVGRHVTHMGTAYRVCQVEGYDYYAFLASIDDGTVAINLNMTRADYFRQPLLTLLPVGVKIGGGGTIGVPIDSPDLTWGLSLRKG